jgi:hypothetical protein
MMFFFHRLSQSGLVPPNFQGDPSQLPGVKKFFVDFLSSGGGLVSSLAWVFFFCAWGSYVASKQAKAFRFSHACVAIDALYFLVEYLFRTLDPVFTQFLSANLSPAAKWGEPIATLVGIGFGGIMGSED